MNPQDKLNFQPNPDPRSGSNNKIVECGLTEKATDLIDHRREDGTSYPLDTIAGILTKLTPDNVKITLSTVKQFKRKYLDPPPSPAIYNESEEEGTALEVIFQKTSCNTLEMRYGIAFQACMLYQRTYDNGEHKEALSSLKTLLDTLDAIDKKIRDIAPNSDPASIALQSDEMIKARMALATVFKEDPDLHKSFKAALAKINKHPIIDAELIPLTTDELTTPL